MLPNLTDEMLQAIHNSGGSPVRVEHADTGEVCWLITNAQMERFRSLFETEPLSTEEKKFLLRQAGERAGWDDPEMDAYDNYDAYRAQQS